MKHAIDRHGLLKTPAVPKHSGMRLVGCLCGLIVLTAHAASAQFTPPRPQQSPAPPPPAVSDVESESVSDKTEAAAFATRPRALDPANILRTAHTIFIHSKTIYVKDSEVENALRKRPEFQAWGMVITRDEGQADLRFEVERKVFTKRFVFSVVEPRSLVVVAGGQARSIIFGDTIAHKVAEKFVRRMAEVRPPPTVRVQP